MAKKQSGNALGGWAFLIGILLAIVLPLIGSVSSNMVWLLVFIGLLVGLLNISSKESQQFMISGVILIIASAFGQGAISVIPRLLGILEALLLIFVPATIVVAIKNVFVLARN